jgi:hypothetical protein
MSTKLCKSVLKLLVQEIDKAAFQTEVAFGVVFNAIITAHPEIAVSDEEWNQLNEETKAAIIERVKQTLKTIG